MRRLPTALLAAATVLLPVLSMVAHVGQSLASAGRNQLVLVTGHEEPEPALHIEAQSGTIDVHCPGCLLDKREPARASDPGAASKREVRGPRAPVQAGARLPLELSAQRSPRAPPAA